MKARRARSGVRASCVVFLLTVLAVASIHFQQTAWAQDIPETSIAEKTVCGSVKNPRCQSEAKFRHSLAVPLKDPGTSNASSDHPVIGGKKIDALPLNATAIVVGVVEGATAHVTEDATGVYSEFSVRVREVIKQDSRQAVVTGSTLVAQRFGGAIRFPSGRVERFRYRSQHFPAIGATYVLFLSRAAGENDYYLYTGYKVEGDRLVSLDSGPQFSAVSSMSPTDLRRLLKSQLAEAGETK